MLDRYGPRRVEAVLIGFAALGALLFAVADSYLVLWLGRALIGVGVSACLMAAVKAYSLYFRPHMQASLSSWMLVAGSLGALTVTTPVEAALPALGWRGVFGVAAVLCVLAGLALWFALPALFKPQKTQSVADMAQGYRAIYAHPHFWRVAPLAMITQGGFMAFSWFVGWPLVHQCDRGQQCTGRAKHVLDFCSAHAGLSRFGLSDQTGVQSGG